MRKLLTVLLILGVGLFVYKKNNLSSYGGTLWSQVKAEAKKQVPTQFEIDRVRHEIANLDKDISTMIRPIAEHMAGVNRLKKEIQTTQTGLDTQKATLLTMAKDVEKGSANLVYGGESFSVERVKHKLQRDFESFRRLESFLKSQQTLLDAKEQALRATQEQLAKVVAKKREFEIRLAQLEADEQILQASKIGTELQLDDSRATQIEEALQEIEHRHSVQRAEIELKTGAAANDFIPVQRGSGSGTVDVQAILKHLQHGTDLPATVRKD